MIINCSSFSRNFRTMVLPLSAFFGMLLLSMAACGQQDSVGLPAELKKLSLEDLMNLEVTLVDRTPVKITAAPSAIQVISGTDIKRSGALNIPDALRLFTNLQVAQLNSNAWIISSRGFNTVFANKLLVMIDGRTVYTPLFGGVIWELQNVLMEDIERIEVVSGPGATMWGANAVNGVINIVTKKSSDTQGGYISAAAGTYVQDHFAARWGGRLNKALTFKIFGRHFDRHPTILPGGKDNDDRWRLSMGGFRMDWKSTSSDEFTLQGDYYGGTKNNRGGNSDFNGQNVLARWNHTIGLKSDFMLQVYYDRYYRDDVPGSGSDKLVTYDLDFQHRLPLSKMQQLIWGVGYRSVRDHAVYRTTGGAGILPPKKSLDLANIFIQDEISISNPLKLIVGTKLLHNVYTGFEFQPSARLALSLSEKNILWASVSRAVRTPGRFDVDFYLPTTPVPPSQPSVAGGPDFVSEKLYAYELGYRLQPHHRFNFSVSTFYNVYHDLYSVEALPGTQTYQIQNGSEGESWGLELMANYKLGTGWRLRGGYTYFDKDLRSKPGHNFDPAYLGNDVKNQAMLQSIIDVSPRLHFDLAARYLDRINATLATARVAPYWTVDARLALDIRQFEISVVGQNLAQSSHSEFNTLRIPRSVYARLSCRF